MSVISFHTKDDWSFPDECDCALCCSNKNSTVLSFLHAAVLVSVPQAEDPDIFIMKHDISLRDIPVF